MLEQIGARAMELMLWLMWPFRSLLEFAGLVPTDMQVWCLMAALFMIAFLLPYTIGDLVLMRRRVVTTGEVVGIDDSGDPSSPIIDFYDQRGQWRQFTSPEPCNINTGTIGARVDVIYDPLNPKRARELGRPFSKLIRVVLWYGIAIYLLGYAFVGFPEGWSGLISA